METWIFQRGFFLDSKECKPSGFFFRTIENQFYNRKERIWWADISDIDFFLVFPCVFSGFFSAHSGNMNFLVRFLLRFKRIQRHLYYLWELLKTNITITKSQNDKLKSLIWTLFLFLPCVFFSILISSEDMNFPVRFVLRFIIMQRHLYCLWLLLKTNNTVTKN